MKFRKKNDDKSKNVKFFHSNTQTKKTKKNLNKSDVNENNDVICNKKNFTRITQKKFYRY